MRQRVGSARKQAEADVRAGERPPAATCPSGCDRGLFGELVALMVVDPGLQALHPPPPRPWQHTGSPRASADPARALLARPAPSQPDPEPQALAGGLM